MFTWLKTIVADFSHGEKIFSLVDSPESNSISTLIYAELKRNTSTSKHATLISVVNINGARTRMPNRPQDDFDKWRATNRNSSSSTGAKMKENDMEKIIPPSLSLCIFYTPPLRKFELFS